MEGNSQVYPFSHDFSLRHKSHCGFQHEILPPHYTSHYHENTASMPPLPTTKSQCLSFLGDYVPPFLQILQQFGLWDSLPKIQSQLGSTLTHLFDFISLIYLYNQQSISKTVLSTLEMV